MQGCKNIETHEREVYQWKVEVISLVVQFISQSVFIAIFQVKVNLISCSFKINTIKKTFNKVYIVYKRTLYINIAKSAIEELGLSLPFSLKYLHPAKKYIGMN